MQEINKKKFDVVLSSNCLEHFYCPETEFEKQLSFCKKYFIIAVPYQEKPDELSPYHFVSFDDYTLKEEINGFKKIFSKAVNTEGTGFWNGHQLIIVYKKYKNRIEKINVGNQKYAPKNN